MRTDPLEARLRAAAPRASEPAPPSLGSAAAAAGLLDVAYTIEPTALGKLLLAATARGLVRVAYLEGSTNTVEGALAELSRRISPRILHAPAPLDEARRELEQFLAGRRRNFELQLDWGLVGSAFARGVLEATARIPYGKVSTYTLVAAEAGSPRAFRAAGTALGRNPLPIVVPCHRVLNTGGGLGGYTSGLDRKRALLGLEGSMQSA